jgi:hypothetical protein
MRACAHCGASLDGRRRHAIYCGGPCRAAASRARAAERPHSSGHADHRGETTQNRKHEDGGQLATPEQEELISYLCAKYPELAERA